MEKGKDYPVILADKDSYFSDERPGRYLFNPSFSFYSMLAGIIVRSGNLAKNGKYGGVEWVDSSLQIFRALERVGVKFEVTGLENLSLFDGPAVFISNHMSTLETVVLPSLIQPKKDVTFVVKKELLEYPFFGHILGSRNPIMVGRSNPREDLMHVMDEGIKNIKSGRSIIIFPQRTRNKYFEPDTFNTLGIKLAKKAGSYVVPLALVTDAWANGYKFKDVGKIDITKKVHITFGQPFLVESNGAAEHERILSFIGGNMEKWGRGDCIIKSGEKQE